jgi:hypothetical protein
MCTIIVVDPSPICGRPTQSKRIVVAVTVVVVVLFPEIDHLFVFLFRSVSLF